MDDIKDFVLSEYKGTGVQPATYSIGKYDLLIPRRYALANGDYTKFEEALLQKYIAGKSAEVQKYKDAKISPIPAIRFNNTLIAKPFSMRDMPTAQARNLVIEDVYAHYNKAIRLAIKLNNAYPNTHHYASLDNTDMKQMRVLYDEYLQDNLKDKALIATAKMGNMLKKSAKLLRGNILSIDLPKIKALHKKNVSKLSKKLKRGLLIGAISAVGLTGAIHFANSDKNGKQPVEITTVTLDPQAQALANYVQHCRECLQKKGLSQLNDVQEHNLQVYAKTQYERNTLIAFAENFHSEAYDDNKGVITIGYGTTKWLNENGEPMKVMGKLGKKSNIQLGQTINKEDAMEQVNRYSDNIILPDIIGKIKVPLNESQMICTHNFAYIAGSNKFEDSDYLQALNSGKSNEYAGQCLSQWRLDRGVAKRFYFANLILNDKITINDIEKLTPSGCYNLQLEDCVACEKNADGSIKKRAKRPVYANKNGLTYFATDKENIDYCLNVASQPAKAPRVVDIMPNKGNGMVKSAQNQTSTRIKLPLNAKDGRSN